jgi:hypothetical protein
MSPGDPHEFGCNPDADGLDVDHKKIGNSHQSPAGINIIIGLRRMIAGSSNGRMADSESARLGSNPSPADLFGYATNPPSMELNR